MKSRQIKKVYKRAFGGSWEIFLTIDWAFDNKRPPARIKYKNWGK